MHVEIGNTDELITQMRGLGLRAGLALNPDTPFEAVQPYLRDVDLVLCMTVFPGFGGQSFIADVMAKVAQVRAEVAAGSLALDIEVDGGIDATTAPVAVAAGANVLVAGSAIFGQTATVGGRRRHPGRSARAACRTPMTRAGAAPPPDRERGRRTGRAVVAGGGIIGTWHALELAEAGFSVDHLEAEAGPTGASVRNFGLVWVSGRRSGAELDVARRARRRWEEVGTVVPGIGFRPMASLTIAGDAAARDRHGGVRPAAPTPPPRAITFLDPDEVRACNPAVRGRHRGGAALRRGRGGRAPPGVGRPARPPVRGAPGPVSLPPALPRRPRRAARAHRHGGDSMGGRPRGPGHRRGLRPPARHRGAWRRACAASACRCCRRRRSPPR